MFHPPVSAPKDRFCREVHGVRDNASVMEIVRRVVMGLLVLAVTIGWISILAPAAVKRLRRDPSPTFPPAPLPPIGPDAAKNAAAFCDAIRTIIPVSIQPGTEDPAQLVMRSSHEADAAVLLTWDDSTRAASPGTFYVELSPLGIDAYYEMDADTDPSLVFWIAVGYLREGAVQAMGHAWIHVKEVDMWHPYSASRSVSDFEPEWATSLPA